MSQREARPERIRGSETARRDRRGPVPAGAGLAAILALAVSAATCNETAPPFDRGKWQAGFDNHDGTNPRLNLVRAARAAGVRPGAARQEIRTLLGEPDSHGPEADIWYLGRDSLSVDFPTLRVTYDGSGRSISVQERTK